MSALKKEFKFRLPAKIILRPLYYAEWGATTAGRFNYDPYKGYSIALNIEECRRRKNKGEVISRHECAHFANVMLHKEWGHGEKFRKIKSVCCKLSPHRKNIRKRKA
ncbi:MAG: SprT-like domain-containing protein [Thermodesulfovibrionales bacterium]|nr:SprT-like domain-containing protein [Thermodesulfovibrionales bacterium]